MHSLNLNPDTRQQYYLVRQHVDNSGVTDHHHDYWHQVRERIGEDGHCLLLIVAPIGAPRYTGVSYDARA